MSDRGSPWPTFRRRLARLSTGSGEDRPRRGRNRRGEREDGAPPRGRSRLPGEGANNSAPEIYAHELDHVVDAGGKYSDDPKWAALHKTEISNNKENHLLSRYALQSPSESFAEMHREIVEKGAESVKMKWPKCVKYFESKGLL